MAQMDHGSVIGTCNSCHDGAIATGKSATHISSSITCDDCHNTTGWVPATVDHSSVSGTCSSCHDGTTATGKSATHMSTSNTCEDCHGISAWSPVAQMDHGSVVAPVIVVTMVQ